MKKSIRDLKISFIVFYAVALALFFIAMVFAFDDIGGGRMAMVGVAIMVAAFVMALLGGKNPKLLIGTTVMVPVATVLCSMAFIFLDSGYYGGFQTEYFIITICCGVPLIGVAYILGIVYMALLMKKPKKEKEQKTAPKNGIAQQAYRPVVDNTVAFEQMEKLYELYRAGILSEGEYMDQKQKILAKIR